jgi:glyoxylase-like metal-dependent hydrolase (beta-lactamase superfamily II)
MSMFDELADGVFRRRYDSLDINVGVVLAEDGVLIVDTRASHAEADELAVELRTLTRLPLRWVVDTHWHWDHTFGNARFPDAEIWGHELCRQAMLERGDSMKDDAAAWLPDRRPEFDDVVITPPGSVFTDTEVVDMGSRSVTLSYHGPAHTDADIVIGVDGTGVVFVGDLLEEGSPPVFDDGFPLSWPSTLAAVLAKQDPLIVPGHGDVMDQTSARLQLGEIEDVAEIARRCLTEGLPVAEGARSGPYPEEFMLPALRRALKVGR